MKKFAFALCVLIACASSVFAGEKAKAYVSAPVRVTTAAAFTVDALVINPASEAQSLSYEGRAAGFEIDAKDAKRPLWIAAKSSTVVTMNCRATQPGSASLTLYIDGAVAAPPVAITVQPIVAPRSTQPGAASVGDVPATIQLGEKPGKYEIEIELSGGVWGELAGGMERLESLRGFGTNAVVARLLIPFSIGEEKKAQDLSALYALQLPSGAWPAAPNGIEDVRSTSWVVFWLGHFAKAGGVVDAKSLERAVALLKQKAGSADPEMRARILPALAAAGQPTGDVKLSDVDLVQLSPAAKLFAALGGANVTLPGAAEWPKMSALELSALACCLAKQNDKKFDPAPVLSLIAKSGGVQPAVDTHQIPLYVLALSEFKPKVSRPNVTVTIRQGEKKLKSIDVDRRHLVVREVIAVTTTQPREGIVLESDDRGVIYRAVVRAGQ